MTFRNIKMVQLLQLSFYFCNPHLYLLTSCQCSNCPWCNLYLQFQWSLLLYRHKCFTRKYTIRKIHTKPHPGLEWHIFHIHRWYHWYQVCLLTCFSICCCMIKTSSGLPQKSSTIFRNLRRSSENVWQCSLTFEQVLENILKSSESGRKSLKIIKNSVVSVSNW